MPDKDKNKIELNKIRLDLAWKHFEHYAKQRVTMFNFHVILVGAVLYAYTTLTKNLSVGELPIDARSLIAGFGVLISIIFLGLDRRNQFLYRISEYNIALLEGQFLYRRDSAHPALRFDKASFAGNPDCDPADLKSRRYYGIISEEICSEGKAESVLEKRGKVHNWIHNRTKYREMMIYYYGLIMLLFIVLTVLPYWSNFDRWIKSILA